MLFNTNAINNKNNNDDDYDNRVLCINTTNNIFSSVYDTMGDFMFR